MPTRYDKEFKQNIINLYKQGESAAQLAREYGLGYSTVGDKRMGLIPNQIMIDIN
ncbi:transposase [Lactiplantibacillus paraplantarum]|uniref:transposase n=1 Tax=Lactiplantibacillus paraplantarum TaxID=60520 RepID=UPI001F3B1332|nr:transposase [Lactiplantibacillus paraplantarum]